MEAAMPLSPGTRLGPYQVTAQIGAGGMGEVYRAHDTQLGRDVALKILPDAFAQNADRLARFQREAHVLAALNHSGIAHIYGLEEASGQTALVMELVEGPTLADRIARGPIPLDEAVPIAKQMAEALEAAHEQGIIHRDLKPANVKVREDGTVKVLDFGLAKAIEPVGAAAADLSESPTITSPAMTERGVILGTAGYMSPEQARGRPVDKRADIWAFGCVFYEMLTGTRVFEGEDVALTLAEVMRSEPDWSRLPRLPEAVAMCLRQSLKKDARQRLRDIGEMRLALAGAFETAAPPAVAVAADRPAWRRALPVAAGVLLTALAAWGLWPTPEPGVVNRFAHILPEGQRFRGTGRPVMALSRDGRSFVYNTDGGLYLRTMDAEGARLIRGTEAGLVNPCFSPDGRSVGYFDAVAGQLKRIDVAGGAPVVIAPATNPFGVSWEADGTVLFGQPEGILRVAAAGGTPAVVIEARNGERVFGPQLLPDGDSVLFTATTGRWDEGQIVIESLSTHERTVLIRGGSDARYVAATGHLVYAFEDGLFARAFDPDGRTVSGGAVSLVQGLMRAAGQDTTGAANYGVSDTGTLAYVSDPAPMRTLVWVDRQGRETPLAAEPHGYQYPRLSPDRTRVAVQGDGEIFVWDLAREGLTNVTASEAADFYPLWTPDGTRLIFSISRGAGGTGLYWQSADGTGAPEPLTEAGEPGPELHIPMAVSANGEQLVYRYLSIARPRPDLRIVSLTGNHTTDDLLSTEFSEQNADVSPNGRWMAYESDRSGSWEIYVSPFPAATTRQWQVSTAGGTKPAWALNGRELFYVDPTGHLMSVAADPDQPAFTWERPRGLLDVSRYYLTTGRTYDVDQERFLFVRSASGHAGEEGAQGQIHVVLNWTEELKRRVPRD
jgi:tRNA A-37 threonylcarbamoyl transferase component Bud32